MPDKEPMFNLHNLAVFLNTLFGLAPLLVLPYILLSVTVPILVLFHDWPTLAGAVIVVLGAAYAFVAEFLFPNSKDMTNEIRNDPMMLELQSQPESKRALMLMNSVLDFSERRNRFVSRLTETLLLVGGGVIGIIGIVQDKLH